MCIVSCSIVLCWLWVLGCVPSLGWALALRPVLPWRILQFQKKGGGPHHISLRESDNGFSDHGKTPEPQPMPIRAMPCGEHSEGDFFTPALPAGKSVPIGDRTPAGRQGALLSVASQVVRQAVRRYVVYYSKTFAIYSNSQINFPKRSLLHLL